MISTGNWKACKEYMEAGNRLSVAEGILYFGISNFYPFIKSLKRQYIIKKTPVTMARILTRTNNNDRCKVGRMPNLPISDINMTEWWISR